MKKKIITATLILASIMGAFFIGKSQATVEIREIIKNPSKESYIHVDSFEDFYTIEVEKGITELHLYANGNEYVFLDYSVE